MSRYGLMTGRFPFRTDVSLWREHPLIEAEQTTIASLLANNAYETAMVGKWHLGNADRFYPTERGFDSFYGLREGSRSYFFSPDREDKPSSTKRIEKNGATVAFDGYLTDVFGQQAIEFLEDDSKKPFFLYLSFTAPHGPMHATEEDLERFKNITDKKRRTYAAMIWAMDRAIGNVLDALDASGQPDNTIVWFLSDNGGATGNASVNLPLAGHKGVKFEGGTRVPFFAHWPKKFKEPKKFDPMMISLDIMPTSLAAAGAEEKDLKNLDGINLMPFMQGEKTTPPHKNLFWHKLWFSAMRDGPWKLIYVQDYGYALYNLENDLGESQNLIKSEKKRSEKMIAQLNDWKVGLEKPRWDEAEVWFRTHSKNHIRIIEGE